MQDLWDYYGDYSDPWIKKKVNKLAPDIIERRKTGAKEKNCTECNSNWAWYSSDYGRSWQCKFHRRS